MGMRLICVLLLSWGMLLSARAGTEELVPDALVQGAAHLKAGKPDLAVGQWVLNGLAAKDPSFQRNVPALVDTLRELGRFDGWSVMSSKPLGGGSRLVYLAGRFERGSLFLRVVAFELYGKEVVNRLVWSLDPMEIAGGVRGWEK